MWGRALTLSPSQVSLPTWLGGGENEIILYRDCMIDEVKASYLIARLHRECLTPDLLVAANDLEADPRLVGHEQG